MTRTKTPSPRTSARRKPGPAPTTGYYDSREKLEHAIVRMASIRTARDIAERTGASIRVVRSVLSARGLTPASARSIDKRVLDDEDLELLRTLREHGFSYQKIADKFDTTPNVIRNAFLGITYRELQPQENKG